MSNASNLANIALADFGQSGQVLTSTGFTTTPAFSASPIGTTTTFFQGSATIVEVGASNASVKVNLLDCPNWTIGKTGKFIYQESPANSVNLQVALSGQFQRHIQYVISQNSPLTGMDFLTTPAGTYPSNDAHLGGVLLPDGRVFCVPFTSTVARIYDPASDTLTTPAGGYPGSYSHAGGVLLPDGRVFCVPYNTTVARIYNPASDTLTTPAGGYPGSAAHAGGVLLPDGRVFCVPRNATVARIYNPVTNLLTTPAGGANLTDCFGATLLFDGRVFCVPEVAGIFVIYNPFNDSLTTPLGAYAPPAGFEGAVLMQDGRVFCLPDEGVTGRAIIYDPSINTVTTPNMQGVDYTSGCLLPDGRVFCAPAGSNGGGIARIYNPATDTTTTPIGTPFNNPGYNDFLGAVMMRNGHVFMVPAWSTRAIVAKMSYIGPMFSPAVVNGPFYNKL